MRIHIFAMCVAVLIMILFRNKNNKIEKVLHLGGMFMFSVASIGLTFQLLQVIQKEPQELPKEIKNEFCIDSFHWEVQSLNDSIIILKKVK